MRHPSSIRQQGRRWFAAATLIAATVFAAPGLRAQDLPGPHPPFDPRARMGRFSRLPATQPTALPENPPPPPATPPPAANTLPAPMAATPLSDAPPSSRPRRATVSYLNGQLNVRADDSSLNQILRAISRQTGLKITGGVADQRVFGDYGPATTSSVLATLLDGTGTNILLLEGDASTPPELILTARGGGPTPPSPSATIYDDAPEPPPPPVQQQTVQQPQPPQPQSGPRSMPQPLNNINGSPLNTSPTASTLPTTNSVPTDTLPTPSTTPSTSGIVDAPNPPASGGTTSSTPVALTPDQVYQQLIKMQHPQTPPQTPPR
jgi:hypothetical protein